MKKGFTLIELLAVIVILAIISLIAIPIVLDIIEDSRRSAAVSSANGYVRAVNYKIAQEILKNRTVADDDYVIGENALIVEGNNIKGITGSYTINKGSVLWAGLCVNGYSVEYNSATGYSGINNEGNYCQVETPYVYDFAEEKAYQSLDAMCTGNSADSIYSNTTNYKIEKIDDLVCLSNLVNSGKDFNGKTIYLIEDLDFNNDASYKNKNTTAYGDINGNGETEGLKAELTTSQGFKPIGTDTKNFKGTFLGYARTIDHLKIDRTTAYVGLFGYNTGTIKGIKVRNASVSAGKNSSGYSYAGIVVGYSKGTLQSIDVEGSIIGTGTYVGGVSGHSTRADGTTYVNTSLLFKGNVTGDNTVGGLIGGASSSDLDNKMDVKGVVYDSRITATTSSTTKKWSFVHGYTGNSNYLNKVLRYYNSTVVAPANTDPWTYEYPILGMTLEAVDGALDTYIGGDSDNDGYYFDYDEEGNITLYSTKVTPIENKLKGSGIEESPYLIRNFKDWKMASATIKQGKYYSVENDIDFTDNKYYALGTVGNKFNGHINGNMHTISNITVKGYEYTGLFGYNNGGTIEGFVFDNITINSNGTYVAIVSYNTGIIKGIKVRNASVSASKNSSGYSYAGIVAGYSQGTLQSIDVEGNIIGTGTYVGGVSGHSTRANGTTYVNTSLLFKGNVTGDNTVGGLIGGASSSDLDNKMDVKGVVYDSRITATTSSTTKKWSFVHGYTGNSNYLNKVLRYYNSTVVAPANTDPWTYEYLIPGMTLEAVDGALDTYIGGDNDNDGYYFDYDEEGNITLYSTKVTPIINTLAGLGTQASPYLISNASDWKMASATIKQGKHYKLTNNINFSNNKFYALGTEVNKFNGYINGNMHTISNVTVNGYDYTGLFGYNDGGTIEGLIFDNITINSNGTYVAIVSYNTGIIKGIKVRNASVSAGKNSSGYSYAGIVAGYSKGTLQSIDVEGNITGTGTYVGGVSGYSTRAKGTTYVNTSLLFKGNVTGNHTVGGLIGSASASDLNNKMDVKGVVYDSKITATTTSTTKQWSFVHGYTGNANYLNKVLKYYNSTVVAPANTDPWTYETLLSSFSAATVDGALDTYIGGDNDNDGYYFGDCSGSLSLLSTRLNPIDGNACPQTVTPSEESTYLGVVYLNPKNLNASCNAQNSVSTTGTKEGCMKFYIYKDDGTNYTMILDHNTSGNVSWALLEDYTEAGGSAEDWETYHGATDQGPVTANKQLALDTAGWAGNPRLITANEIATITGASTSLSWNSSKTYTQPVTDKSTQMSWYYFDGNGTSYSGWQTQVASSSNKSAYAWLFDNTYQCLSKGCNKEDNNQYSTAAASNNPGNFNIHGYWTSDVYNINYPWAVTESGLLGSNYVTDTSNIGIRPVITLSKTSVTVN